MLVFLILNVLFAVSDADAETGCQQIADESFVCQFGPYVGTIDAYNLNVPREVTVLNMSRNRIEEIGFGALVTLRNLRSLDLSFNNLRTLSERQFIGNDRLDSLDLSSNRLRFLSWKTFEPIRNLRHVQINGNRMLFIKIDYELLLRFPANMQFSRTRFDSFNTEGKNLKVLDRFRGVGLRQFMPNVTAITTEMFLGLEHLTELDLCLLTVRTIERDAFMRLDALVMLDVSFNHLSALSSKTFASLKHLQVLRVNNNRLATFEPDTFDDLVALRKLNLAHNQLERLDAKWFRTLCNLQYLDLSANRLRTHGSDDNTIFLHQSHLEYLDLSYNRFDRFENHLITPLISLKQLNVSGNRISVRDIGKVIRPLTALERLEIDGCFDNEMHTDQLRKRFKSFDIRGQQVATVGQRNKVAFVGHTGRDSPDDFETIFFVTFPLLCIMFLMSAKILVPSYFKKFTFA